MFIPVMLFTLLIFYVMFSVYSLFGFALYLFKSFVLMYFFPFALFACNYTLNYIKHFKNKLLYYYYYYY
jgi:hypothetical protein